MSDENWERAPLNDWDALPSQDLDDPPRPDVGRSNSPGPPMDGQGEEPTEFPTLSVTDRFKIERRYHLVVPGLPDPPETILGRAEIEGLPMPSLTSGEISRLILFRHSRWVRKVIQDEGYPDPDGIFGFDTSPPKDRYFRWPLCQVERMCLYFRSLDRITDNHLNMSRHVIAWIARGHDLYEMKE